MADLSQIRVSGTLYDIKDAAARSAVGAPSVAATASAMLDRTKVYVYTGSESGYTNGNWYYYNGSAWTSGGVYNSVAVETDTSLSVSGAPADAKVTGDYIKDMIAVGDNAPSNFTQILLDDTTTEINLVTNDELNAEITDIRTAMASFNSVPYEVKRAMDSLFRNMVLNDYDGSDDYLTVHTWASAVSVVAIAATYTQSGTVYDTDPLSSLKKDLIVTATFSDASTADVSSYTLSGNLATGTSAVTVTYQGRTTTFNVTVTSYPCLYYWDFTRSLTDLKQGAVASITNCNRTSNGVTIGGTSSSGVANNQYIDLGDVFGLGKTIDIRLKDVSADFGNAVGVMFETWDGENDPGQYNSFGWRYHSTAKYLGWGYMTKTNASWRYPANNSSSAKKNKQLFDGDHTLTIKITSEGEIYVYNDGVDLDIQYVANATTPSERPQFDENTEAHSHVPIIGSKLYYPNFYTMTVVSAMIYETQED